MFVKQHRCKNVKGVIFMRKIEDAGFRSIKAGELPAEGLDPVKLIGQDWMLVTAGREESFNTMTASWGFLGEMWNKPCAVTVLRPQRYTKEFADREELFTLSFFGEEHKKALAFCGRHSGRDTDKVAETGLTPVLAGESVAFEEANLVLLCRKLYVQEMSAESFIDRGILEANYSAGDLHTAYIGEIVRAYRK